MDGAKPELRTVAATLHDHENRPYCAGRPSQAADEMSDAVAVGVVAFRFDVQPDQGSHLHWLVIIRPEHRLPRRLNRDTLSDMAKEAGHRPVTLFVPGRF